MLLQSFLSFQVNRHPHSKDDLSPPLPPSATHPLFKTEPPKVNSASMSYASTFYPSSQTLPKSFVGTTAMSPWEREEREEIRREQSRQWREHHIFELSNLPHRSQQQEEQLKTLIFDRDFERLAQEQGEMEEDNDTSYGKDNVQEVIRLAQGTNQLPTPVTSMKQIDVKTNAIAQSTAYTANTIGGNESVIQSVGGPAAATHVQPKSILKHNNTRVERTNESNPSSPSKQAKSTTFADDRQNVDGTATVSSVMRDLNNLSFSKASMAMPSTPANHQNKDITDINMDAMNAK